METEPAAPAKAEPTEPASTSPTTPPGPPLSEPEPVYPPAAATVAEGTRTEREVQLADELDAERTARIDREKRIAELEDENFRLRAIPAAPPVRIVRRVGPVIRLEE